jgi:hypothetical protein
MVSVGLVIDMKRHLLIGAEIVMISAYAIKLISWDLKYF